MMKVVNTALEGVLLIQPSVFSDYRGFFLETYHYQRYTDVGISAEFIQDNMSSSKIGVLRGLHYQHPHDQAKLVQVVLGKVFDVAVDIRMGSPSFGKWQSAVLSDENKKQLFIPEGFAHGFCVLSDSAIVTYKCNNVYTPDSERGVHWADQTINISWPVSDPILSEKDSILPELKSIPEDHLPKYVALA